MKNNQWFSVDKAGLANLIAEKGPGKGIEELIQNAWDENVARVAVTIEMLPGRPYARVIVEDDDPKGFDNLDHAYTLFAESRKKTNPEQRGRFNVGEKLSLARCVEATISSTTGTIHFDADGRHRSRVARESGSRFEGIMRMTRAEYDAAIAALELLIPPVGIYTTINGRPLTARAPLGEFRTTLSTEIADDEGVLRRTTRQTVVRVFAAREEGNGRLYEMGIPVVETGDTYDVDIGQKVPLNFNRDNVPPAYLRAVRTAVLNAMHGELPADAATAVWVREAASDPRCSDDAITSVVAKRFGERRVSFDLSDPEGTNLAVSRGYTVVHGGSMSSGEWENARRAQAILPAGQVTPSPRIVAQLGTGERDPYEIAEGAYTPAMQRVVAYAAEIGARLLGTPIAVRLVHNRWWRPMHSDEFIHATFGNGELTINVARVAIRNRKVVNNILIHEFAHHISGNHLGEEYHNALADLGAGLAELYAECPDLRTALCALPLDLPPMSESIGEPVTH
jgi:hypothetical protein